MAEPPQGRTGRTKRKTREAGVSDLLARALRRERRRHGLTIRALARESGVATNTLSLIENGRVSPGVATLQRVATTLGVPIAAFLQPEGADDRWVHVPKDDRVRTTFSHGFLQDLGAGMADRTLEPFVITLNPEADSGATPIVHEGLEFVFCLEGRIEYILEGRKIELGPGDSLLFEARLPHRWRNTADGESVGLLVLSPVVRHESATAGHFAVPRTRAEPLQRKRKRRHDEDRNRQR